MSVRQELLQNKRGFWLFIPLLLIYACSYFQRTALPGTIYNTLVQELGFNAAQMATLGASFVYTYAVFQLISGALVDRFCGARVVVIGGFVFIAGTLLFPLCHSTGMLYLARMLTGIGASTMYLSLVRETDRLFGRKNYAVFFGIAYFCGYGGGLIGSLPFELLCPADGGGSGFCCLSAVSLRQKQGFAAAGPQKQLVFGTVQTDSRKSVELAGYSLFRSEFLYLLHHPNGFREEVSGRFCRVLLRQCRTGDIYSDSGLYVYDAHGQFSDPAYRQSAPPSGAYCVRNLYREQFADDCGDLLQIFRLGIRCDLLSFCGGCGNPADLYDGDAGGQLPGCHGAGGGGQQYVRLSCSCGVFPADRNSVGQF